MGSEVEKIVVCDIEIMNEMNPLVVDDTYSYVTLEDMLQDWVRIQKRETNRKRRMRLVMDVWASREQFSSVEDKEHWSLINPGRADKYKQLALSACTAMEVNAEIPAEELRRMIEALKSGDPIALTVANVMSDQQIRDIITKEYVDTEVNGYIHRRYNSTGETEILKCEKCCLDRLAGKAYCPNCGHNYGMPVEVKPPVAAGDAVEQPRYIMGQEVYRMVNVSNNPMQPHFQMAVGCVARFPDGMFPDTLRVLCRDRFHVRLGFQPNDEGIYYIDGWHTTPQSAYNAVVDEIQKRTVVHSVAAQTCRNEFMTKITQKTAVRDHAVPG